MSQGSPGWPRSSAKYEGDKPVRGYADPLDHKINRPPSFTLPVVKEVAADRSPPPFFFFFAWFWFSAWQFANHAGLWQYFGSASTGVWIFCSLPDVWQRESHFLPEAGLPVPLPVSATGFDKSRFT